MQKEILGKEFYYRRYNIAKTKTKPPFSTEVAQKFFFFLIFHFYSDK